MEQLFGGFWLAVLGVCGLIFFIMAMAGRMSKMTTIHYLLLYFMCMTLGYGYKWITGLISIAIISWVYLSFKSAHSN